MKAVRNLTFLCMLLVWTSHGPEVAYAFGPYADWVATSESLCDDSFHLTEAGFDVNASCVCTSSSPQSCWDYIDGGGGSAFCSGAHDGAEDYCGNYCGVYYSNCQVNAGQAYADFQCVPLCAPEPPETEPHCFCHW